MIRHTIPRVIEDRLISSESTTQHMSTIKVGSEAWYAWLNEPDTRSFAFRSQEGSLTARCEHSHGNWYWYAYRSQEGHLRKTYLGKSKELTLQRLKEAAAVLSVTKAPQQLPHTTDSFLPSPHQLTAKLSIPLARSSIVARPRLIQQLNAAMRNTLTILVAPAGWGKTTLLHAWYAHVDRSRWPLAWISLDANDNDPLRFWTYIITALNTLHLGVGETPLTLLNASSQPSTQDVLTSLLNALSRLRTDTTLVLDDFHHIVAQPIQDALTFLIEHLPPHLHVVLVSRSDPPLPLARQRAQGTLTEVRVADLRFTVEESTEFLTKVMGLPLSTEQVAVLQARTEGWIAGLHLAALSLKGRQDVAGFIEAFTGSHRYVVDYLVEEVLSRQPADVQDFLLQTCILDRLCGPLCDAVRGQNNSRALLEFSERSNLFLVALDEERQWYRYHHLFAEALHSRLQHQQPTMVADLHRRASQWYEQHELYDEAVTHALAVPEVERAVHLIEEYARLTHFPSQYQVLQGWLTRLPDAFVRNQPTLCILHAITLMFTMQLEQASERLQDAERCLLHEGLPILQRQALLSLITTFRGYEARMLGDYEQGVPLGRQALELLPEAQVGSLLTFLVRLGTFLAAASAYLVDGDMTPATEHLVKSAVASARAMGNLPAILKSLSNQARFQLMQGRMRQAAITLEQALHSVSQPAEMHSLLHGMDSFFLLGELLYEWNQLERAEEQLAQGMDLVRKASATDADTITRGYLVLARLQQARGQGAQALQTLDAFAQLAQHRGFAPTLLAQGAAVRAQVGLAQGDLRAALHWAETRNLSAMDGPHFQCEREYLTLVRVRIAQAQEQPMGPFLSEALALLERLLEDAELKARMRSVIEIVLLRALALEAQGDHTGAFTALGRVLTLAEPEGYIRLFLDEGTPMLALLRQTFMRLVPSEYVVTLLEAAGEQVLPAANHSTSHPNQLMELLTAREREVLRLMVGGASNREIADHLVLSVNTVKKHVVNICGKLNVRSRTHAIAKVRTLNILVR